MSTVCLVLLIVYLSGSREEACAHLYIGDSFRPFPFAIIQAELLKCSHHRTDPHHQQRRHVIGINRGCSLLAIGVYRSCPLAGNGQTDSPLEHRQKSSSVPSDLA